MATVSPNHHHADSGSKFDDQRHNRLSAVVTLVVLIAIMALIVMLSAISSGSGRVDYTPYMML